METPVPLIEFLIRFRERERQNAAERATSPEQVVQPESRSIPSLRKVAFSERMKP